jgi:dipeptidyl aminopeptidase/acylaminoacyl peptidase
VAPGQSYNLIDELERQHKTYEVVYYPDEAHGLADPAHQLDSYERILAFFDRYLKE